MDGQIDRSRPNDRSTHPSIDQHRCQKQMRADGDGREEGNGRRETRDERRREKKTPHVKQTENTHEEQTQRTAPTTPFYTQSRAIVYIDTGTLFLPNEDPKHTLSYRQHNSRGPVATTLCYLRRTRTLGRRTPAAGAGAAAGRRIGRRRLPPAGRTARSPLERAGSGCCCGSCSRLTWSVPRRERWSRWRRSFLRCWKPFRFGRPARAHARGRGRVRIAARLLREESGVIRPSRLRERCEIYEWQWSV